MPQRNRDLLLSAAVSGVLRMRARRDPRRDLQEGGRRHRDALPALPHARGAGRSGLIATSWPWFDDAAPELLAALPPAQATRAWMDRFIDYMTRKIGMADALRAVIASGADPYAQSFELCWSARSSRC